MEEILREETRKYKGPNPITEKINKEVTKDDMDDLMKKFEKMEAHLMKRNNNDERNGNQRSYPLRNNNQGNYRPRNNIRRDRFDWNQLTCYTCREKGHVSTVCRKNQRNRNRGNNGNQMNYLDEEYYDEYDNYNTEYNNDIYNMEYGNDSYEENEYIDDGYDMNEVDYEEEHDMYEMNYEERNDMYPAPPRRSERNKDRIMNEERNKRTQMQWEDRQRKAQNVKRRGFTEEQLKKAQETRRRNNICGNCGHKAQTIVRTKK
jgi:hypothetical protein